jgi:aspartate racemase
MTACVGIVGGLGVGATVHYYEKITSACKARGMVPDLVFMHADVDTQRADPDDAAGLRRIAADLQRRDGVEAILLAGTDLALMFDEASAGFPAIDVARLHIEAIVEQLA